MDNERVESRPGFRLKDFYHCLFAQSVCCQAVNGLGWQSDRLPLPQQANGSGDGVTRRRGKDFGFHSARSWSASRALEAAAMAASALSARAVRWPILRRG